MCLTPLCSSRTRRGRALNEAAIPFEVATTVITLAELNAGVLAAGSADVPARRMVWARLRVHLAEAGRRMGSNDLWIAAIAVSRGLPVITQDDDFTALEGATGFVAIRV